MRALLLCVAVLLSLAAPTHAQVAFPDSTGPTVYDFGVGFGIEVGLGRFENLAGERKTFFSNVLLPDFSYGPWTAGLMVKLRLNRDGFRDEDYDSTNDILSILRFVQYNEKDDPGYYARLGDLEDVRMGYGQIFNEYHNTVSLDDPKRGVIIDNNTGTFQFETTWSNLIAPEVFGLRGAYRPFLQTRTDRFQHLIFGVSLAGDFDDDGGFVNTASPGTVFIPEQTVFAGLEAEDDGSIVMVSLDAGLPIATSVTEELLAYTTFTKMMGYGSGLSFGLRGTRNLENGRLEGWLEQRILGKEYLPSYFDALYELERIREGSISDAGVEFGDDVLILQSKRNRLAGIDDVRLGSHMAFSWRSRPTWRVQAHYDHIWNQAESGWLHVDVRARAPDLPYQIRFIFDRVNVGALDDIFSGPGRDMLLRLELAYQVWDYVMLGFKFKQSFESFEQGGRIVGQRKRTRVQPNFVLVIPL